MKIINFLLLISLVLFAVADDSQWKDLHDESCVACHFVVHDRGFYTSDTRKMKTYAQIGGQVSRCVQRFNIEWFPEEEVGMTKYLNKLYYHFPVK